MSLFNVPGFIKLFFPKDNVQTKYFSVHQIPVMTLQKQIAYIPKPPQQNQNIIFIHSKSVKQNKDLLTRFVELKRKNYQVYLIPEQGPLQNFCQIKENIPKGLTTLGKMIINGEKQHPLIKWLKCNCQSLYDYKMLGANRIVDQFGVFIKNQKNQVKYMRKRQTEDFLNKQLGPINFVPQVILDAIKSSSK